MQLSQFSIFVFYHPSTFDISMNFCNFAKKYFCRMMFVIPVTDMRKMGKTIRDKYKL